MTLKTVILICALLLFFVFAQECGKISKDGQLVDVSTFKISWKHDFITEYEMSICSETLTCESNKWPIIQYYDTGMGKKCFGLGKLSTATISFVG